MLSPGSSPLSRSFVHCGAAPPVLYPASCSRTLEWAPAAARPGVKLCACGLRATSAQTRSSRVRASCQRICATRGIRAALWHHCHWLRLSLFVCGVGRLGLAATAHGPAVEISRAVQLPVILRSWTMQPWVSFCLCTAVCTWTWCWLCRCPRPETQRGSRAETESAHATACDSGRGQTLCTRGRCCLLAASRGSGRLHCCREPMGRCCARSHVVPPLRVEIWILGQFLARAGPC